MFRKEYKSDPSGSAGNGKQVLATCPLVSGGEFPVD